MFGQKQYAHINELLNQRFEEKKVLIAAHRGAWGGNIVENTIPAFAQALNMGADMFECDLSLSTDGELFVFHDGYEKRLLLRDQNIRTFSSAEIDQLELLNSLGDWSGYRVARFREVLDHFRNGELFNVDRSWPVLARTEAVMRQYPHVVRQAVVKTPVKPEYLAFFRDCPVKYMYMPIARSLEEVRQVLTIPEINTVGVEIQAAAPEEELFREETVSWLHDQGLFVWINTIRLTGNVGMAAGFHDDKALLEGPDTAWGVLMDRKFDLLQTDWPWQLARYRDQKYGI